MNILKENSYIIIVVLFSILGILYINADPPLTLTGHHTPWVDPPVYLDTVKSKILTGDWNPSNFQINYPLYIYPVYWIFLLFGQSYLVLRIFSVLSVAAGLFFILGSLKKNIENRILFWGSFFIINYVLIMYARLGLHHCFMFLWIGLSLYFISKESKNAVYIFPSGVCAALAFLTVFYAFVFIFPLFLFVTCETFFLNKKWKNILSPIYGFLLVIVLYLIIFRLSIGDLFNYLFSVFVEKKTQFHGKPEEYLNITWQIKSFFGRMPFLTILSFSYLLTMLLNIKHFYKRFLWFERLGFMWLGFGIILLSHFQYRPIRYHLIIIPPMLLLLFGFLRNYCSAKSFMHREKKMFPVILIIFSFIFSLLTIGSGADIIREINLIYYLLILLFIIIILLFYLYNNKIFFRKYGILSGLIGITVFAVGINVFQYYYYFIIPKDSLIVKAGEDLPVILNDDAVVVGTYANILLFNTGIKHVSMTDDKNMLQPTHYIVIPGWTGEQEITNRINSGKGFLTLKNYTVRGYEAKLYRNMRNTDYVPTEFEKGIEYFKQDNVISAHQSFYAFYEEHPSQPDNLRYLAIVNMIIRDFEKGIFYFRELLKYHKNSIAGRINLSITLIQLNRFDEARDILKSVKDDVRKDSLVDALLHNAQSKTKPVFDGFVDQDCFMSNQRDIVYER